MKNVKQTYDFRGQRYLAVKEHHGNMTVIRNYEVH